MSSRVDASLRTGDCDVEFLGGEMSSCCFFRCFTPSSVKLLGRHYKLPGAKGSWDPLCFVREAKKPKSNRLDIY